MREILFRGKRIDNGMWVEGFYSHEKVGDYLTAVFITERLTDGVFSRHRVDPKTIGQFSGIKDMYGNKIFEDDILVSAEFDEENGYGVVKWSYGAFEVRNTLFSGTFHENFGGLEFEVIGNIHDNQELLEGE